MLRQPISSYYAQYKIWRKKCPFWAGFFLIISSIAMLLPAITDFSMGDITLTISNNAGIKILLLSTVLCICGIAMWVNPFYRIPAGIVGLIIGILSLQSANFGGFGIGLICSIIGSALGLSWYDKGAEQNLETRVEISDTALPVQQVHDSAVNTLDTESLK